MVKFIILLSFLGGFSAATLASTEGKTLESISVNFGSHTEFFNAVQKDTSGGLRKWDFAPVLGVGVSMPISDSWKFMPEFNWLLPQSNEDGKIIKNVFMLRADFGYDLIEWLRLRAGTSLMWLNQQGRGGSVDVNNGNATSTFYYPDGNQSSWNNTLDLGVEALYQQWSFRLQTYTYMLFKSERRAVSYSLLISYYWDQ